MLLVLIAAASLAPPPLCPPIGIVFAGVCEGSTAASYSDGAVREIRRFDEAGDGLDPGDIELERQRQDAEERARSVAMIVGYDLDGDWRVDRGEIERARPNQLWMNIGPLPSAADQRLRDLLFTYDGDRDDLIEREEMLNAPLPRARVYLLEVLHDLLRRDPNSDGRLDVAEQRGVIEAHFRELDRDGNGSLSGGEVDWALEMVRDRPRRTEASVYPPGTTRLCALPPVPDNARLIVYTSRGGAEPPPEQGEMPWTDLRVEPGDEPLYVVVTSFETVHWRLSGSAERIVRLVVSSQATGHEESRVTGLPESSVTALREDCLGSDDEHIEANEDPIAKVWNATGRRPDIFAGASRASSVSLPSLAVEPVVPTPNRRWVPSDICANSEIVQPEDFGRYGVQAHYNFLTQDAPSRDLTSFLRRVDDEGFSLVPMTVNLNGHDTLFVLGRAALTSPEAVERELRAACSLRTGPHIYLVHVRYNSTTDQASGIRVR